jgi:hypothetical protein
MKFSKKTTMILSFALGTIMFATTAIAEIASKGGYDLLKDSLKYTAESVSTTFSSYTMDASFVMKADGTVVSSETSTNKFDGSRHASETSTTSIHGKTKDDYYCYSDKNVRISKNSATPIYYLTELTSHQEVESFRNPFKEEGADDMERIADILVGNLKEAVIVKENSDGSKELSGSLDESQIPALINAIVSLQTKNEFRSRQDMDSTMPKITKDVFVKEVSGKMIVDKNGLMQSITGKGTISGKDDNGKEHTLTFDLSAKLYNVNSTKVTKPDLSGKKVEKDIEIDRSKLTNPKKYIGKYKTDILIEKGDKFEKIGERIVEITSINETSVSGKYYEQSVPGYEDYFSNKKSFTFSGTFQKDSLDAPYTATNADGNTVKGYIYIDQWSGKINFNIDGPRNEKVLYDGQFSRVFE